MKSTFTRHALPLHLLALLALLGCLVAAPSMVLASEAMVFEDLEAEVFGTPAAVPADTKVVVVTHGDRGSGDYLLDLAGQLAGPGVVSMVLARPGCSVNGRRSSGTHNSKKGDHYTSGNISAVNDALEAIKAHYQTDQLYMIGHSGGAATTGVILGKYPETLQGAVLISLPAHVKKWRRHRDSQRGRRGSGWPRSLSPHSYVDDIPQEVPVVLIVGDKDTNTPVWLSELYLEKAVAEGKSVIMTVVPGAKHNFSGGAVDPKAVTAMEAARAMLAGEQAM